MKDQPQFFSGSPTIFHPHYVGEDRKMLRALVKFPDGRLSEMDAACAQTDSPLIRDIYSQYDEESILLFTQIQNKLQQAREEMESLQRDDRQREDDMQALFRVKAQALEIAEVKNSTDSQLSARIRKSKTTTEVYSLVSLAMLKAQL